MIIRCRARERKRIVDSSNDPVNSESDEAETQKKKEDTDRTILSGMSMRNSNHGHGRLQRMIYPLAEPNEKAACRDRRGGCHRKRFQDSGAGEQKRDHAHNHKNLIPVIKGKFRERVFHWQRYMVQRVIGGASR